MRLQDIPRIIIFEASNWPTNDLLGADIKIPFNPVNKLIMPSKLVKSATSTGIHPQVLKALYHGQLKLFKDILSTSFKRVTGDADITTLKPFKNYTAIALGRVNSDNTFTFGILLISKTIDTDPDIDEEDPEWSIYGKDTKPNHPIHIAFSNMQASNSVAIKDCKDMGTLRQAIKNNPMTVWQSSPSINNFNDIEVRFQVYPTTVKKLSYHEFHNHHHRVYNSGYIGSDGIGNAKKVIYMLNSYIAKG